MKRKKIKEVTMLIDIHIHEEKGSFDSQLSIEKSIAEAEAKGLDALCITDHDSLYWRRRIEGYQKKTDVLLIVGVEIFTLDGDLLCFGIDTLPKKRMRAKETIAYVKKQGGVCIAAHPYRENNRGLGDLIYQLDELTAVEGLNGRTKTYNNRKAMALSRNFNLKVVGGSDAHTPEEVGQWATYFNNEISNEKQFIESLKKGQYYPVHLASEDIREYDTAI